MLHFTMPQVQLSKCKKECERPKNQMLRAVTKTDEPHHLKTNSKNYTAAVNRKQGELAKLEASRLKAQVGPKDRTDGLEGNLSALEIANQKLSAQIDELIFETNREIYGMDATTPEHNKQDKTLSVDPHLHSSPFTTRRTNKYQTGHPPSLQKNPALSSVARVTAHRIDDDRQRPAIPIVSLNSNSKVIAKQPKSEVRYPVDRKNAGSPNTANQNLPLSRERKMRQCPSATLVQRVDQKIQSNFSNNLSSSSTVNERQASPRLLSRSVTRDLDPVKSNKCKDASQYELVSPIPGACKRIRGDIRGVISKPSLKLNRIIDQKLNDILIDKKHLISRKEHDKTNSVELRSQTTTSKTPRGDVLGLGNTSLPLTIEKESHQQSDSQRKTQVTLSNYSSQSDDESQDDFLSQLLGNIKPRSAKSISSQSQNSSPSISPKNNSPRPWYELLPIPNVEVVEKSRDLNNAYSTDSDSSGNTFIQPSLPPRRENDTWTYLGDQTALMPRPLIRKICKFVETFDSPRRTDEEIEFKDM